MGCTSSAPNMDGYPTTPDGSCKEKDVKDEHVANDVDSNKESGLKEMKLVLPSCDNLEKNLELACQNSLRNGSSQEETQIETIQNSSSSDNLDQSASLDKDTNEQKNTDSEYTDDHEKQLEENVSALKEIVDRVILDNAINNPNPSSPEKEKKEEKENLNVKDEEENTIEPIVYSETLDPEEEIEVENDGEKLTDETTSPSQSECSRATRWEALADIAAELPPTLAVDPITGQIYSLAK